MKMRVTVAYGVTCMIPQRAYAELGYPDQQSNAYRNTQKKDKDKTRIFFRKAGPQG